MKAWLHGYLPSDEWRSCISAHTTSTSPAQTNRGLAAVTFRDKFTRNPPIEAMDFSRYDGIGGTKLAVSPAYSIAMLTDAEPVRRSTRDKPTTIFIYEVVQSTAQLIQWRTFTMTLLLRLIYRGGCMKTLADQNFTPLDRFKFRGPQAEDNIV